MKKNVGSVLALYPTPLVIVGTIVDGKPNWTLVGHLGIIGHDRVMVSMAVPHYSNSIKFQSTLPVRGATANLHKINAEILAECLIILRKTEKRGQKACIGWKTKAKSRKRQENKVRRIRKIHDSLRAAPCVYTIKIPSAS